MLRSVEHEKSSIISGLGFVVWFLCLFSFHKNLTEKDRAGCITLIVFLFSFVCL